MHNDVVVHSAPSPLPDDMSEQSEGAHTATLSFAMSLIGQLVWFLFVVRIHTYHVRLIDPHTPTVSLSFPKTATRHDDHAMAAISKDAIRSEG